jgi:hypothetical protein
MNAGEQVAAMRANRKVIEAASRNGFIDWSEFWSRDRTAPEWLLEDILARGRAHAIYAVHKGGKSLLMLWCALELTKAGALVVYLDYEMGEDDLYERLEDMGYGPESDLSLLRYNLLPSLPPLDTADGARELLSILDRERAAHPGRQLALVIDTTSRAIAGDENSADTLRGYYRHTGLGLKQRGVTSVRLDHSGKDPQRGQRGTSAKGDDVDVVWRLHEVEGGYELRRELSRLTWVPERVSLRKVTEPVLHFERAPRPWPAGTQEAADLLDRLGVSPGASTRAAQAALREADKGRRREVVAAAQRWRQMIERERMGGREPPREPPHE